jgi:hypothetical protein
VPTAKRRSPALSGGTPVGSTQRSVGASGAVCSPSVSSLAILVAVRNPAVQLPLSSSGSDTANMGLANVGDPSKPSPVVLALY